MPGKAKRALKRSKKRTGKVMVRDAVAPNVTVRPGTTLILKVPGMPVPDTLECTLVYVDFGNKVVTNVGSGYLSWRLRSNSAYDPDPSLGSGAIAGFSELAAFYANYRVLGFAYDWEVVNLEAFPVALYTLPSNSDLGLNSNLGTYSEEQRVKRTIVSQSGGMDRAKLRGRYDLETTFGSKMVASDANFNSGTGGNPVNLLFHNFAASAIKSGAPSFANGIASFLTVQYRLLFYGRKSLNN
jgi:hypothetical protein